ncbi:terminase large subunit domain-containing protein [Thermus sp.]|uniref:terminase large subunit domain-containing protein n=1 Tax=Thermus sp. TaxID=275 RepID=UPI00298F2BD1|nr:terminase family protein [Thermus sp.]MDW8358772.1 terminase family protein [Thermus sp.]
MASELLLPYQSRWVKDQSRFKIGLWSRQTGKSFAGTLEAVLDAVERPGTTWVLLSAGERQSRELAEKARAHLEVLRQGAQVLESRFFDGGVDVTQLEIRLPNASRLVFLPANPRTARGYTGNVFLDEFAFHQDSHAIWAAMFPIITRRPDLRIRVMSTPAGPQGKFYELWEKGGEAWSRHKVTIYDAVREGLPVDPEELRRGIADDWVWQQEYLCEFVSEEEAFLPWGLILAAEAREDPRGEWDPGQAYLGMDVGRHRDLTVLVVLERVGDVYWTRHLEVLHRTPFALQEARLHALLPRVRRACVDATGLGEMLAEGARRAFGPRVEPVKFTPEVKADLAQRLRLFFEDRRVRIPEDPALREDLHAVRRVVTPSGNVRYDAERSERGHADRFWALALALHAAETRRGPVEYHTVLRRAFAGWKGAF